MEGKAAAVAANARLKELILASNRWWKRDPPDRTANADEDSESGARLKATASASTRVH